MQPKDSQQQFAESMIRDLRAALPQVPDQRDLSGAVNDALRREAHSSELTLALGRMAAMAAFLVFSSLAYLRPDLVRLPAYPGSNVAVSVIWFIGAVILFVILRRGFEHRAVRRIIPLADAAAISVVFLLIYRSLQPNRQLPTGLVMVAIIACALIAFSGSLRLSRSAARYSTVAGTLAAVVIAALADLGTLEAVFVVAAVYATGLLSGRLTRMIRKVITNEIAQVQLAHLYQQANDAAAAGKEVLEIVSHDLRNPIHTIGMAADLMLDSPERRRQYDRTVAIIKRSTSRMQRLVQDLLDVTKLEKSALAIEVAPISVETLLSQAKDELGPLAQERNLEFTCSSEGALPKVVADPGRILQVLSNLVGNAVKFTPAGGRIVISAALVGDKVKFAVIDTGPGIPPEQVARVFGRFWQARPSDRRGLGLGLTIAKSIVEAHGGEIGVESIVGEGTTFWFTVPTAATNLANSLLLHRS
jgi:signal transduction histidine kinase